MGSRKMVENYPTLFVDTSAWIALNEKKDSHHKAARNFVERNKNGEFDFGSLHTSDMILQETYTFLLYNYNHNAAVDIVESILDSEVIIHPFRSVDFKDIWTRVKKEKNKLSFVDWSTVSYMEDYGIRYVFTFDGDFDKLGYNVMPKRA